MCLALMHSYKQAMATIRRVQQSPPLTPRPIFAVPAQLAPEISREPSTTSAKSTTSSISSVHNASTSSTIVQVTDTPGQHNYAEPPLVLLSEVISSHDRYASSITLATASMVVSAATPFLDKLLPYMLHNFLSPAFILNITRIGKRTLFPNGYPGPPPPIPSAEEQAEWRAKLVAWRGKGGIGTFVSDCRCCPILIARIALVLPVLLGADPSHTLEEALNPLSNEECNLRLVVFVLDRLLLALFPELAGHPL